MRGLVERNEEDRVDRGGVGGAQGGHRDPTDRKLDQCILFTDNRTPFKEIVAVLDALYSPKRDMKAPDGSSKKLPVFNMTFSVR